MIGEIYAYSTVIGDSNSITASSDPDTMYVMGQPRNATVYPVLDRAVLESSALSFLVQFPLKSPSAYTIR
jgi:hypothetical protein